MPRPVLTCSLIVGGAAGALFGYALGTMEGLGVFGALGGFFAGIACIWLVGRVVGTAAEADLAVRAPSGGRFSGADDHEVSIMDLPPDFPDGADD